MNNKNPEETLRDFLFFRLSVKVVPAVVAIIYFFLARKPLLGLPYVPLPLLFVNNRHPPVVKNENRQADHPFDHYPENVENTKQKKP